ncbi:LysM and BON domain-containing protein [Cognatilysobacter bugurensis]|uniref:Potassium binding protein Kbp n=1 Tax=Cognatilysobacter bugurensis TaxID=543356 RepID=A0A918T194_9GAMM|nr:peptidoglycan-binding protein LysM [Lysobacter bugurensis]
MSIIDFVKGAGEKIFKPGEARRETAIEKHLARYGITGISVEVDGDKATLTGVAKDTATREKAVLIAGNIEGIGSVDDRLRVAPQAAKPAAATGTAAAAPTGQAPKPAAAAPAAPVAATSASADTGEQWSSRTYTVKSGDTLSKIAKEMYGEASKYPQIFEANKPMLEDPDKIYPGQVLRIPPEE